MVSFAMEKEKRISELVVSPTGPFPCTILVSGPRMREEVGMRVCRLYIGN